MLLSLSWPFASKWIWCMNTFYKEMPYNAPNAPLTLFNAIANGNLRNIIRLKRFVPNEKTLTTVISGCWNGHMLVRFCRDWCCCGSKTNFKSYFLHLNKANDLRQIRVIWRLYVILGDTQFRSCNWGHAESLLNKNANHEHRLTIEGGFPSNDTYCVGAAAIITSNWLRNPKKCSIFGDQCTVANTQSFGFPS